MKWYKNPLFVFTLGLQVFALGALAYNFRTSVIMLLISVVLGAIASFYLLKSIQPKGGHLPVNTAVSALIAFLLLNPALNLSLETLFWTFLGGVLVVMAKYGPRYKKQLIFNPATFGLLLLSTFITAIYGSDALLPTFVSWWGTDYAGSWALIILLPLVSYATYKFRKLYLVISFLIFNALWIYFNAGLEALVYPYTTGTIYFLAGVMLLEPKTSPTKKYWQIGAALLAVITYRYIGYFGVNNVELWAVIAVNLVHLLSRLRLSTIFQKN
ncbi:hypothetical protein GW756_04955 [bacterium]|nr:hypothetical protein [bacterium]NCQ55727.1 hypothetical protein [Candidatus Parcubacteria bacterium]NCS67676.1 hypothetical protein [Candidatus Peregrinibacteria bacterium]NCS96690.1 hypothetical protein [bacterium]